MGAEFRGKGINVALTPMMNLMRAAAAGRNWESAGADPYLAGVAAANDIQGVQSNGVIACAKHFVANEQVSFKCSLHCFQADLYCRSISGTTRKPKTEPLTNASDSGGSGGQASSSNIDDRTLHEVYALPFAASIRAGVGSVMCSYK